MEPSAERNPVLDEQMKWVVPTDRAEVFGADRELPVNPEAQDRDDPRPEGEDVPPQPTIDTPERT